MFEIEYYQSGKEVSPVKEFIDGLDIGLQSKAIASMDMLACAGNMLRMPYSRYLADGLFELRIERCGIAVRLLYFFHGRTAVITNGFVKKTKATPLRQLKLARARRTAYLNERGER